MKRINPPTPSTQPSAIHLNKGKARQNQAMSKSAFNLRFLVCLSANLSPTHYKKLIEWIG
ncbi:hypothetical protein [Moraxella caviae]|uniref:hypothetical protein n=1 Tax=Moraxella caviae TaxID=34060 RepID=UPI0011C0405A|nr:hypothetical protein [Moraxella caviae]